MYSSAQGKAQRMRTEKAGSGLVVNGNRVARLVVEDFVEIWALGVRKA